uniref:AB hydrolase-1 domain-containing protein n=1 Tax=Rhizophora mucronata TaxID=61149 RepID=A0A2P2K5E2_RHIMU
MASLKSNRGLKLNLLTGFLNSRSRSRNPGFHWKTTRTLKTLAFEEVRFSTDDNRPHASTVFVLHGLLGSGRNWRSFARNLASSLSSSSLSSGWRMALVDLRNHGNSAEIEGLDPPHDMLNSAKDLADLVKFECLDWPDVVIGHSMGGKVALQFALSCARGDYGPSAAPPKQVIFR